MQTKKTGFHLVNPGCSHHLSSFSSLLFCYRHTIQLCEGCEAAQYG